jgi:tRNA A37 threonylcarbamoyladenosine biosynthesis protein TsaE
MLSEIGSDSSNSINYAATVLAEGIAGSGKSTGFTKHLIDMLGMDENIKKEVLGNIWFLHTSKAQA